MAALDKTASRSEGDQKPAAPSLSLPKGGGAIRGMGEKFAANPVTGTGSMTVPIATSPGRSGFGPQLSLSYDSGSGNGPFGFGWSLSLPSITRKTDKGLPQYRDAEESDTFVLSGAEDLVPVFKKGPDGKWLLDDKGRLVVDEEMRDGYRIRRYRPRIEGLFARIERWTHQADGDVHWRSLSKDNILAIYGKDTHSRIADPDDSSRIFSWLICETRDDRGNAVLYEYTQENGAGVDLTRAHERNRGERDDKRRTTNRYVKRIHYGNRAPLLGDTGRRPPFLSGDMLQNAEWLFEVVFDYDEDHYVELPLDAGRPEAEQHRYVRASGSLRQSWSVRPDPFSAYRAGFEVRTYRRCHRVLMFHRFEELGDEPYLVRSTEFDYADLDLGGEFTVEGELDHQGSTRFASFIRSVIQSGYVRDENEPPVERDGVRYFTYLKKSLPPLTFEYSKPGDEKDPGIQDAIHELGPKSLENLPIGLDGQRYQWVDLDGEGLSGILTEQADAWFYKPNLGGGLFGGLQRVARKPSLAAVSQGGQQFLDLAGDGQLDLVQLEGPTPGFYERNDDEDWESFRSFASLPNLAWDDPNLRFVDLTGDGHADVLITEDQALNWYPSLAEEGFGHAQRVQQALDEEKGPRLVLADGTQSIHLADLSGDGLTDLVRIRNGEVCYWPNLGYGRFGPKVTMDNAPWFDTPDQFDQRRIRLADIDGSGTTDIIYIGRDAVHLYFNQSGNRWSTQHRLEQFPPADNLSAVMAVDLLGKGTACLVWSSPLPAANGKPMRYIDLMGGRKPHLLVRVTNNLGAEMCVQYAPSTRFYAADKAAGRPWLTRLPFPVHVVERVETYDCVSRNRFVTRYAYHHGYFDGEEREFRGFGMVEQWDTEELGALSAGGSLVPAGGEGATNTNAASHVPPVLTRTWFHTGAYPERNRISTQLAREYYGAPEPTDPEYKIKLGHFAATELLADTVLPGELAADDEREACRALKGTMLRQEVYAEDGTDKQRHPYTVTEQNFIIRRVQPKAKNRHGVFFVHPREAINYHYERNPDDPRVSHTLTLAVDEYGNVLRSVAVGYRRKPGQDLQHTEHEQTHLTFTENRVANRPNESDWYRIGLPVQTRTYEIVKPPELALSGSRIVPFRFEEVRTTVEALWPEAQPEPDAAKLWSYENWDWRRNAAQRPPGTRLRLIEHVRTLYRKDDLTDLQALDSIESLALPGESFKLAFTPELLGQIYQRPRDGQPSENLLPRPTDVLGGQGADRGGYLSSQDLKGVGWFPNTDPDDYWWLPSGRVFFSPDADVANPTTTGAQERNEARQHFFLPRKYSDPFGQSTTVDYDNHDLLIAQTKDALSNSVTAQQDYRVLQPKLVTDSNGNRSHVAFDALGLVAGTAIMGRIGENLGDTLDHFEADLTQVQIGGFYDAADPHVPAPDLLKGATTRIIYDLDRFRRTRDAHAQEPEKWEPVFAATLARETHFSDPLPPDGLKIQISFNYSDGFGREIQKKIQAEPGPVPIRDAQGKIIVGTGGKPQMTDNDVTPRWVGSGWTIFNNKGKPIRRFEPFFTDTHRPDFDVRIGVSPVLFYDAVERVIATLHPNQTYEKVVFDPWRQATYDVNDTVDLDPRSDPHIKGYVERYFTTLPPNWKTWLQERIANPNNLPSDTGGADPERDAAVRALKHAGTPTIAHFDSLGRSFLTVADNGSDTTGNPRKYKTRVLPDIEGNQREVVDAKERVVIRYDYDMLGNRIHQASMEAGERWMLKDVRGKPGRAWDSRGHNFTNEYDRLRRPVAQWVRGTDAAQSDPRTLDRDIQFAKTEYGEGQADDIALNLRTRVFRQYDGAGVVTNMARNPDTGQAEAYDFKGNLLRSTREVAPGYKDIIDWATAQPTGESFPSSTTYDALNRPVMLVAPDNSVIRPTYNEANLLNTLEVNLRGASAATLFVTNIDYNAKRQRTLIQYGNGAETRYRYDPDTFRLIHLYTRRGASFTGDCENANPPPDTVAAPVAAPFGKACGLQNLHYTYDPAGNITHIRDDAQQAIYFKNKRVEPSADYTYDAIYRLIEATGREHLGQNAEPVPHSHDDALRSRLPHPGDGNAMGLYCEKYQLDEVGNFTEMSHHRSCQGIPSWTRAYAYEETSLIEDSGGNLLKTNNRLSSTTVGNVTDRYIYDAHGNMVRMPHLGGSHPDPNMHWDCQDQLRRTDLSGGGAAYYTYDAAGQRVRKVIERLNGTVQKERLYLGGFEVYREYSGRGDEPTLERETLHIMDDKQRIAMVETRTQGADEAPQQLIRYQLGNHLGSASLELDDQAQIISYEEYTPYGSTSYQAVRSETETRKRYRYTGKERDEECGLYYHRRRYYSSWLARWISVDPIGIVGGINLYLYARSNPVSFLDPHGTQPLPTIPRFDPGGPSEQTIRWGGRSVAVHYFPGTSNETVFILGGVHQDERRAIELTRRLLERLRSSEERPYYNIVFIPNLFGNRRNRQRRQTNREGRRVDPNRNFPLQDESLGESARRGGGVPVDAEGREILPENVILMALVEHFRPTASLSIHSHGAVPRGQIRRRGAASVTVDPAQGREPEADFFTREMAEVAWLHDVRAPGNFQAPGLGPGQVATRYPPPRGGVTWGGWSSHAGRMNQYLIETLHAGWPPPRRERSRAEADIRGWLEATMSIFLADPAILLESARFVSCDLGLDSARQCQVVSSLIHVR